MTDRQFLRQLLLAYLVKQAAEADPYEPPRRRRSGLEHALAIIYPGLLGGGAAGFAGYRYGGRALDRPIDWLSKKIEKYKELAKPKMTQQQLAPNTLLVGAAPEMALPNAQQYVAAARQPQIADPRRYALPRKLLQAIAKRPGLIAGLTGAGGALAAGGLGHLIHSLVASD